jgi:hypothetical protein
MKYWLLGMLITSSFSAIRSQDCSQYGARRILFCDNIVTIAKPPAIKDSVYNYWKYYQIAAGVKEVLDDLDSSKSCCNVHNIAKFTISNDTVTSDLAYGLSCVSAPPSDTVKSADYILYGTVSAGDVQLYVLRLECARSRALVKADTQVLCYTFNPSGVGRTSISNFGIIYDTILAFEKKTRKIDGLYIVTQSKGMPPLTKKSKMQSSKYNAADHTLQIYYSSPARQTTFAIVNLSGKEVAKVVKNNVAEGNKSFSWNTAGVPMGVYLLRMKSGDWIGAEKIMLTK